MLKSDKALKKKKLKAQIMRSSEKPADKSNSEIPSEEQNAASRVSQDERNQAPALIDSERSVQTEARETDETKAKVETLPLLSNPKHLEIQTQPAVKDLERTRLSIFNFLMMGIASLIPWNGILAAMDFFQDCFIEYNIPVYFPIPVFIAINLWSQLIHLFADRISINYRIIGTQIIMAVMVISLPFEANYSRTSGGFWICLILVFIACSASTVLQVSTIGFSQKFPGYYVSLYFTGTGIAGTIICVLRIICLAAFGNTSEGRLVGTVLFFVISGLFMAISIVSHYFFIQTHFYEHYMKLAAMPTGQTQQQEQASHAVHPEKGREHAALTDPLLDEGPKKADPLRQALNVFHKIKFLCFLMWLIYVQTFMMFPAIAIRKHLNAFDAAWSVTLIVFSFNIFDTVGKYLTAYREYYNLRRVTIVIMIRFLFYITYISRVTSENVRIINDDWFAFLNSALYALTNGVATSCLFVIGPELVENHEKEKVGFILSSSLFLGILSGAMLAIPLKSI